MTQLKILQIGLFVLALLAASCGEGKKSDNSSEYPACERLFGAPNENTGLEKTQCGTSCASCEGSEPFRVGSYSDAELEQMRGLTLLDPVAPLTQSPYERPQDYPEQPELVCGISFMADGKEYSLQSFDSAATATAAGAVVTHQGACGACSSLQDLAVYIETPDLTEPVRLCGIQNLNGDLAALRDCISRLGFTAACSTIWAYNSINTREECFDPCIAAIGEPYHLADGSPNACIACDESKSGPVFKAVSGRTRRNSGLPTALCRPCSSVAHIDHHYF